MRNALELKILVEVIQKKVFPNERFFFVRFIQSSISSRLAVCALCTSILLEYSFFGNEKRNHRQNGNKGEKTGKERNEERAREIIKNYI